MTLKELIALRDSQPWLQWILDVINTQIVKLSCRDSLEVTYGLHGT